MKNILRLLAFIVAMSAGGALPALAQMQGLIAPGDVLGNGTDQVRTPTDTPLLNVLEQGILGTSVNTPGTGTLESLLPVQTVTGASKTYATSDLFQKTRRSNSGAAMTDTLPASTVTGLVNGTRINIANVDASATDTLTAGAGTSIASGCTAIGPGRDEALVYDLANTIWRGDYNSCSVLLSANNLSDLASATTARTNLGLGTAATQNTGTSGATIPLLNGANTWSGVQTHNTGDLVINGGAATAGLATVTTGGVVNSEANATVAQGGTGGTSASGTLLDNITGFSSTGLIDRTGAGAYSFTAPGTGVLTALGDATNAAGGISTYPVAQSTLSGLGTGVSTALADNVGSAGAFVVNGGALGTPGSGTATNLTGLPLSTGIIGFGSNVATALGNAINAAGGVPNIDGSITTGNCLKWGPGIEDSGGTCGSGGGGSPGGSSGAIQYNNGGSFGGVTIASGDIPLGGGSSAPTDSGLTPTSTGWTTASVGTNNTALATTAFVSGALRDYLAGLTISNDSTSPNTVLDIAPGCAEDITNTVLICLTTTYYKSTAGAWAAGAGSSGSPVDGMGNGLTIANAVYDICLGYNGGSPDIWFDTSNRSTTYSQCANKPSGISGSYFRRIGTISTDSVEYWALFSQNGDRFDCAVPYQYYGGSPGSASAFTISLYSLYIASGQSCTVPSGFPVQALISGNLDNNVASAQSLYISSLAQTDEAPSTSGAYITGVTGASSQSGFSSLVMTNASGQIRGRVSSTSSSLILYVNLNGYIDTRGRFN